MSADMIERVAKICEWTQPVGPAYLRTWVTDSGNRTMASVDSLTADGMLVLIEKLLDAGCGFDKTHRGYFVWKWKSRLAGTIDQDGWLASDETLESATLSAFLALSQSTER